MSTNNTGNALTLGSRIRLFRQSCQGQSTQAAFSQTLGVDQQRLSGYENGTKVPHTVIAALVSLGANPYWILFGEGRMRASAAEGELLRDREVRVMSPLPAGYDVTDTFTLTDFYVLPLYAEEAAAGQPKDCRTTEVEGPAVVHRTWCPHPQMTDFVRIVSTGDTMAPSILPGSIVTIDRGQTDPEHLEGSIVAISLLEGIVVIKRLRRNFRGGYIGVSDNSTYSPIYLNLGSGDRILGIVQTVYNKIN